MHFDLNAPMWPYGSNEPITNKSNIWFLVVGVSNHMMRLLHRVALPFMATCIALFKTMLLVAFALCAWITLRYTLRPLREISASASAVSISLHSMHTRLKIGVVPLEIAPLIESFNCVLKRLKQGYRVQQEFLCSAAHELMTLRAMAHAEVELGGGATATPSELRC